MDKKKLLTSVFIDAANYHYGLRKIGWHLDYLKFQKWLADNYDLKKLFYYEGIHSEKSFLDSHPNLENGQERFLKSKENANKFFKKLRSFGYRVYSKPISSVYDNTKGDYILKCNFDVELTMDALLKADEYEQIILCSGDGDFLRLVKHLKNVGKKVIVMGINKRTNYMLKKHCNQFISLNGLRKQLEYVSNKAKNAT